MNYCIMKIAFLTQFVINLMAEPLLNYSKQVEFVMQDFYPISASNDTLSKYHNNRDLMSIDQSNYVYNKTTLESFQDNKNQTRKGLFFINNTMDSTDNNQAIIANADILNNQGLFSICFFLNEDQTNSTQNNNTNSGTFLMKLRSSLSNANNPENLRFHFFSNMASMNCNATSQFQWWFNTTNQQSQITTARNQWQHITITFQFVIGTKSNSINIGLMQNGTTLSNTTCIKDKNYTSISAGQVQIGGHNSAINGGMYNNNSIKFNGMIDWISLHNTVLTESQVKYIIANWENYDVTVINNLNTTNATNATNNTNITTNLTNIATNTTNNTNVTSTEPLIQNASLPQIKYVLSTSNSNPNILIMTFKDPLDAAIQQNMASLFTLQIQSMTKSQFNYTFSKLSDTQYQIEINILDPNNHINRQSATLTTNIATAQQIEQTNSIGPFFWQDQIQCLMSKEASSDQAAKIETQKSVATASTAGAFLNSFSGSSGAAKSVALLGLMELLRLQNINYPIAVQETFKMITPFPPTFLFRSHDLIEATLYDRQSIPLIFRENDFSPYLINNHGESLLQMIIFVSAGLIIIAIRNYLKRRQQQQNGDNEDQQSEDETALQKKELTLMQRIGKIVFRFLIWNLISILCVGNYMIGCVAANLEIFFFPMSNAIGIVNFFMGFLLFIFNIFIIFHCFMLVYTADRIEWEIKNVTMKQYQVKVPNKLLSKKQQEQTKNAKKLERHKAMLSFRTQYQKQKTLQQQIILENNNIDATFHSFSIAQKYYMPKTTKDKEDFLLKYQFLYKDFKDDHRIQRYFIALDLLRIFLVSFSICIFTSFPLFQSILNTLIISLYFLFLIILRPLKSLFLMLVIFLMESVLFISYFTATVIEYCESQGLYENTFQQDDPKKTLAGDVMVWAATSMGFISGIAMIITVANILVTLYKEYKKRQINQIDLNNSSDNQNANKANSENNEELEGDAYKSQLSKQFSNAYFSSIESSPPHSQQIVSSQSGHSMTISDPHSHQQSNQTIQSEHSFANSEQQSHQTSSKDSSQIEINERSKQQENHSQNLN